MIYEALSLVPAARDRLLVMSRGARRHWETASKRYSKWDEGRSTVSGRLDDSAARVAIFAHFDRAGRVRPYVLEHLEALAKAGLSVVFVSNCQLEPSGLIAAAGRCPVVVQRPNQGHDFGAYRAGLSLLGERVAALEVLVLVNDSVYGPFDALAEPLGRCSPQEADVWSITDSWGFNYHLQSYFLVCYPAALNHERFQRFWSEMRPLDYREAIIRENEVGLTRILTESGVRCRAMVPYVELAEEFLASHVGKPGGEAGQELVSRYEEQTARALRLGRPLNPTHAFWRESLQAGSPYLKRDLFRRNPTRNPELVGWRQALAAVYPDYDRAVVEADLVHTLRNRSY